MLITRTYSRCNKFLRLHMKNITKLTSLQFFILTIIINKNISGSNIQSYIKKKELKLSKSSFYQLMSRLYKLNYINKKYKSKQIKNQKIIECEYSITQKGLNAWKQTKSFYNVNY